jgi:hypothetical protein
MSKQCCECGNTWECIEPCKRKRSYDACFCIDCLLKASEWRMNTYRMSLNDAILYYREDFFDHIMKLSSIDILKKCYPNKNLDTIILELIAKSI